VPRQCVGFLVDRCDHHAGTVVAENKFKMTDAAPVDAMGLRIFVTGSDQLAADRRATGRAAPGHLGRNRLYGVAHWHACTGDPVETASCRAQSKLHRILNLTESVVC